ncbi:MAG: hypothetical protein LBJ83_02955 [Oscillospiraceae bacterium]|nr:hypothetical protein [Oscillospiraceae bacterium]
MKQTNLTCSALANLFKCGIITINEEPDTKSKIIVTGDCVDAFIPPARLLEVK